MLLLFGAGVWLGATGLGIALAWERRTRGAGIALLFVATALFFFLAVMNIDLLDAY